jgi:hypothetical protein
MMRVSATGALKFYDWVPGPGNNHLNSIYKYSNNDYYVTGESTYNLPSDLYIDRIDSTGRNSQGPIGRTAGGIEEDRGQFITSTLDDELILTGTFRSYVLLKNNNIFIGKFDRQTLTTVDSSQVIKYVGIDDVKIKSLPLITNDGSGYIIIKASDNLKLSSINVYDIQGNLITQKNNIVDLHTEIDLTSQYAGVYILELITDLNEKLITKVVVVR